LRGEGKGGRKNLETAGKAPTSAFTGMRRIIRKLFEVGDWISVKNTSPLTPNQEGKNKENGAYNVERD